MRRVCMLQLQLVQVRRAGPLGLREVRSSSFAAAGPDRSDLRQNSWRMHTRTLDKLQAPRAWACTLAGG
eukprot:NODE_838_length_1746_cov_8.083088_g690_i0.p4 GENE.NODE_838_length_1746_cov_8.083088_g690_i0~~NODE_838_length_1746_cov_8.083088_g690_i0.p4  ORF type:complete len:69 (+),score=0.59 NODE_838_length_1746_cov_8.083088_g690_i0:545-751(+)